ncbi:hypothetical protein [Clostridium kluyveri]|uniref:Uncharacterized protein n=1 Tax=Clostridium kluyveri TaxID=1534 RepID=A0A1L5F324_CLOKL|nr:hypothetical protein [Clostridium kluyveri]APM37387.1 hypothetical protein BS101_00700 [Clostridium kluyveri]
MKTTANLGLKKPEGTDVVNIDDLNYNADALDAEVIKKASSTQDGRMAKEDKVKFDGISAGANKVEQSSTNGNIKIDGVEKKVYTPPTGTNPYGTTKTDVGLGNVTNDAQVKRTEMGAASGVATLDSSGVNAQAPKAHTHTKSQITDFPSSLPANGGNSTTVNNHTANGTPATTEKTDIIKMINEVFQSGTNVKSDAISAVNSKGGSLGSDATWDDIIAAINAIARGQGNAVESQVLSGVKFSNSDGQLRTGTMSNKGAITITPSGSDQTIPAGYHNGSGNVSAVAVPVANVLSGTTIAGQTGTMPNRGAVTLTPGTADQIISAGYHNGSGKVKGEPNLKPENIKEGISEFGIMGTLKEKQDIFNYLLNIPSGSSYDKLTPIGFVEGEGMWFMQGTDSNGTAILLNSSGTVTKTLTIGGMGVFFHASKNYIMRQTYPDKNIEITNKSGTVITTIPTTYYGTGLFGCINQYNNQIYFAHATTCDIYNLSGTLLYSATIPTISTNASSVSLIPCKSGAILLVDNSDGTSSITTISDGGVVNTKTLNKSNSKENKVYGVLLNALI